MLFFACPPFGEGTPAKRLRCATLCQTYPHLLLPYTTNSTNYVPGNTKSGTLWASEETAGRGPAFQYWKNNAIHPVSWPIQQNLDELAIDNIKKSKPWYRQQKNKIWGKNLTPTWIVVRYQKIHLYPEIHFYFFYS